MTTLSVVLADVMILGITFSAVPVRSPPSPVLAKAERLSEGEEATAVAVC